MMKIHDIKLLFTILALAGSILACNFQAATLPAETQPRASLTPPSTAEFELEEPFVETPYFYQEFDDDLPESWLNLSGWTVSSGILSASSGEAGMDIPGDWQEKRLIIRLRIRSGAGALAFNVSETGAYHLGFSQEEITLDWVPAGGEAERLSSSAVILGSDWHLLVLEQAQGLIRLELDGEPLPGGIQPGYSPSGSLQLLKSGEGWLEIDRLVVAPPGD